MSEGNEPKPWRVNDPNHPDMTGYTEADDEIPLCPHGVDLEGWVCPECEAQEVTPSTRLMWEYECPDEACGMMWELPDGKPKSGTLHECDGCGTWIRFVFDDDKEEA